ncbi:hypothetical protein HPP92_027205, partial [Vanilla planifolia]
MAACEPVRALFDRLSDRCFSCFPCLADRAGRSSVGVKFALVLLHVVFVGVIFLLDTTLIRKFREEPWSWTCVYCNVTQPPRSKHCHDCDKCVLQFDHHCVWLGTCIGK